MMTSSNGNIFRVTGPLCGEFTGPGEFPTQRPVTRSFDVYFDLRPNKRLSKQWRGWWFETKSCSLWRHCNESTGICLDNYLGLSSYAFFAWNVQFAGVAILITSNYDFKVHNVLNTLRPRQNRRYFPDDKFKWIFLNENIWISVSISLKFVPSGPINNIPTLVHVMAWRRAGQWWLDYRRIYASLDLNEF